VAAAAPRGENGPDSIGLFGNVGFLARAAIRQVREEAYSNWVLKLIKLGRIKAP
jgi:hypothetical protein